MIALANAYEMPMSARQHSPNSPAYILIERANPEMFTFIETLIHQLIIKKIIFSFHLKPYESLKSSTTWETINQHRLISKKNTFDLFLWQYHNSFKYI